MESTVWFSTFHDCIILNDEVRVDLLSGAVESDLISTTADAASLDRSCSISKSLVGD